MTKIVLIDDHPLAINGIGAWLSGTGRFEIAGIAGNLAEAKSLFKKLNPLPEIVILDVSLGKEDGLGFIPILKEICDKKETPMPGILVCSMYDDKFLIHRAMVAGANAYVAKTAQATEIITAIDCILAGNTYINPKYKIKARDSAWLLLSSKENEIVSLVKRSMTNQQIADHLGISIRTVENHLAHIYDKTGVNSRGELFNL